jgi:hypothetical protein
MADVIVNDPEESVESTDDTQQEVALTSAKILEDINSLESSLKTLKIQIANLKQRYKDIKYLEQENKKLKSKKSKKRSGVSSDDKSPNKNNNGFKKPLLITNELYSFFATELPVVLREKIEISGDDTEKIKQKKEKIIAINEELSTKLNELQAQNTSEPKLSRTDVARLFSRYVKFYKLQDAVVKKSILLDKNNKGKLLKNLLQGFDPSKDILTHINIQKYFSHHFLKTEGTVPAPSTDTPKKVPVPVESPAESVPEDSGVKRKLVRRARAC